MGRTRRKRNRIKEHNFLPCDGEEDIIHLNLWLSQQGIRRNRKLVLAVFTNTGRGVLTKKRISAGEELINLPLNSTINVITVLTDIPFCDIFLNNKIQCLSDFRSSVSFQSLLAFYVSYLKLLGQRTKWYKYLKSLPKNYSVPYFLPCHILSFVDNDIVSTVIKQKHVIKTSYNIFVTILQSSLTDNELIQTLKSKFSKDIYEWAYFTVNTRCVYMDLSKLVNLNNIENSILCLVNDNTKISLCPYLDMINHSRNAKNETTLMVKRDIENINLTNLNLSKFSDVWFSIYTKNNFNAFTEVFICYGDSSNIKLITEYGFYLPNNDLDYVSFTFDDIVEFLQSNSINLSQEQNTFITNHGLNKDLYIDLKGLNFNLYGLLTVVRYYYDQTMDVSRLIYSAAICSNNDDLNNILKPMVRNKVENIKYSINSLLEFTNKCVILENCISLMSQYVYILEKFIKC